MPLPDCRSWEPGRMHQTRWTSNGRAKMRFRETFQGPASHVLIAGRGCKDEAVDMIIFSPICLQYGPGWTGRITLRTVVDINARH